MPDSSRFADFSLTDGGPTYRVLRRLSDSLGGRIALLIAIMWLPLLILSAAQGVLAGGGVRMPFLFDIAAHVRFLLAVPLLIIAEFTIDRRLSATVRQFVSAGIIGTQSRPGFGAAVSNAERKRDSRAIELVILALALIGGILTARQGPLQAVPTWIGIPGQAGGSFSAAGWWYRLISIPLYQFLLYRWLWRYLIWSSFLRHVSRLDLQLTPAHPDRAGGLSFLGLGQAAFSIIVWALSAVLSAIIADSVLFAGMSLERFKIVSAVFVILMLLVFLGPLLMFIPKLLRTRISGLLAFGALGSEYTQSFDDKWVHGPRPGDEPLLGTSDIQSLADLGNSYAIVQSMRLLPFGVPAVMAFLAAAIVPLIPLLLLIMPAADVGRALLKVLRGLIG